MDRELVKPIICNGKRYVVVKMGNSAHVMPIEEWKKIYGKLHPERWDINRRIRRETAKIS